MSDWPGVVEEQWPGVEASGPVEDVARSVGSGAANSVAGALGGSAGDVRMGLIDWLGPKLGIGNKQLKDIKDYFAPSTMTSQEVKKLTGLDRADYEPQTKFGEYGKSIGEFGTGAVAGAAGASSIAGALGNVARFGIAPGVASQAAGDLTKGTPYEGAARIAAGMAAPGLASGVMSPLRDRRPEATAKLYAEHVDTLDKLGVPLSAGERSNNKNLRIVEDELNPNQHFENREALTRQATKTIPGMETPVIRHATEQGGESTIGTMGKTVGKPFDELMARNGFEGDEHAGLDLVKLGEKYTQIPGAYSKETVDALHGFSQRFTDLMRENGGNRLTGEQFFRFRKQLNDAAMGTENVEKSRALADFTHIIDDAFERSVKRNNPADAGKVPEARENYKKYLTIEGAVKGGADHISPAALERSAVSVYGSRAHQKGLDPFYWAPAAKEVLKTEPNTNSGARAVYNGVNAAIGHAIGGTLGALGGHAVGMHEIVSPQLVAEGLGAAILPPAIRAAQRPFVTSKPAQAYWGNQVGNNEAKAYRSIPGLLTLEEALSPSR